MRTSKTLVVAFLALLAGAAGAQIFIVMDDSLDDRKLVASAASRPQVGETRGILERLRGRMLQWKERDYAAVFGTAVKLPEKLAMPIGQQRAVTLSGLRYSDEKMNHDHCDVYAIGKIGYVEVYFGLDGQTAAEVRFFVPPDADFVKVSADEGGLAKRLAWDKLKLDGLEVWIADKWSQLHKVQVDSAREQEHVSGDWSRDIKSKLAAWKATGETNGWKLQEDAATSPGGRHWRWYDKTGKLVREAYPYTGNELPNVFIWVHPGTNKEMRREEGMGQDYLSWWRWCRADGTNIRYEARNHGAGSAQWRADTWVWYDGRGKEIRVESDTNGDGIPDRVAVSLDAKEEEALSAEKSWAVHPELIPEESRIGDEVRAVPVREGGEGGH